MGVASPLRSRAMRCDVTAACLFLGMMFAGWGFAAESPLQKTTAIHGDELPLVSSMESEAAPHGQGNLYAPEVHRVEDRWIMWYGAQGKDGHDRIHAASSQDGRHWQKHGVVIDCGQANHVNDPTVVRVAGVWWMFYTEAKTAEDDQIAAATSNDGLQWQLRGIVLRPGQAGMWDSRKIGRPSVLHEHGRFRLWYDGQPSIIAGNTNSSAEATAKVGRAIGYAESTDGLQWQRREEPVWISGAGAIQVSRDGSSLIMVYESHAGTHWAMSSDGLAWQAQGLLAAAQGTDESSGHVTPFLHLEARTAETPRPSAVLYYGAASRPSWNFNRIASRTIEWPVRRP